MNEERMLELQWIRRTNGTLQPCFEVDVLDPATESTVHYAINLRVCPDPRCPCFTALAYFAPLRPEAIDPIGPLRNFRVDVNARGVDMTTEPTADPETLRLAEIFDRRLPERAWEELRNWFWTAKLEGIETAPVSKISIDDLPSAEGGQMIPFTEVFPLGLSLNFTLGNAVWSVDERYCVQPKCRCTEGALSFLMVKDVANRQPALLPDIPAVRYDYRSQATRELVPTSAGAPSTRELLAALKRANPSLDARLELHHQMMQSLYARDVFAQAKLQRQPGMPLPARSPKVGRNDPCPCGSGKKFKKCCGA